MTFKEIPRLTRNPTYRTCTSLDYIEENLERYKRVHRLDMDPDFQRAHVWNEEKQTKFVEYLLKGGQSGREIYFNMPGWQKDYTGDMVLVDGKQRLEAVRRFLKDEIPAFGQKCSEFGPNFPTHVCLYFNVNDLPDRQHVLQWYIDLNDGGIAHTKDEIQKVKDLIVKEKAPQLEEVDMGM